MYHLREFQNLCIYKDGGFVCDLWIFIFPFTDGWCNACMCVCVYVYLCSCVLPKVDSKASSVVVIFFFFCWQQLIDYFHCIFNTQFNLWDCCWTWLSSKILFFFLWERNITTPKLISWFYYFPSPQSVYLLYVCICMMQYYSCINFMEIL